MSSIKQQLLSGVFYTALAKYSGIIVSLVVAGVLARLISPVARFVAGNGLVLRTVVLEHAVDFLHFWIR